MQLHLHPHPDHPPSEPFELWATVDHAAAFGAFATTNIWFGVRAPASRFRLPEATDPERVDGLWQSTCFEAFLRKPGRSAYREWNFSPSTQWAAYSFTAYRDGMSNADVAPPYLRLEDNLTWWSFGATISVEAEAQWELGLSAVLEEQDGTKSYWALAHAPGPPDFHNPDCFAARLP